jgi:hypothetical protein
MAHTEWREAGKPNEGELIKTKKNCKSKLRKSVKEWFFYGYNRGLLILNYIHNMLYFVPA